MKVNFLVCVWLLLLNISYASSNDLNETVQTIAQQLTKEIKNGNELIAIPPFMTLDNKTTMLGRLLSEKLITEFSKEKKKITPVERDFIFKLTNEMKLGMTGLVEPKTIQQVGKFSGASYVLVGTVQRVGKDIQVSARLVRTETSKVEKSVEIPLKSEPHIADLYSQEIKTLLIPTPEETDLPAGEAGRIKMMRTNFDKLRRDYEQLQDELEKLKLQMAQVKDEKSGREVQEKQRKTQDSSKANEYVARGNIAYDLQDFNSAIDYYNKAIQINQKYAEAYNVRGNAYSDILNNGYDLSFY